MLPKILSTDADESPIKKVDDISIKKGKKAKKPKKPKAILKEIGNDEDVDSEDEAKCTPIQYDMPKPGPHAKVYTTCMLK